MRSVANLYRKIWTREFSTTTIEGVILFVMALAVHFFAIRYAARNISLPVTDIILSNIRAFDVDLIVVYGALALILFASAVTLLDPKRIPFVLKSLGLFIIIRSISITLTHIGPFASRDVFDPTEFLDALGISSSADLFFSGHTGMPYLLALIFWDNRLLRGVFLATSVVFAIAVLMGHIHYSIDVFAAVFITYTIFHIAQYLFKKDWELSRSEDK